jgi:hypothetical protein
MRLRDKLSRFIDKFQMAMMEDSHNALNAIPRRTGYFKALDAKGDAATLYSVLYFPHLLGYKDPANFAS